MRNVDPKTSFAAEAASRYDDTVRGDESETVECLRVLARGGPVLELAIGTGRIALPLAQTGLRVDGIELSPHMVARLRAKPGGDSIAVTMGDMASQILEECHVTLSPTGIRLGPIVTRYVWPSEMDLMARIAGLRLHSRWAGWNHESFDSRSVRHVSVYGR